MDTKHTSLAFLRQRFISLGLNAPLPAQDLGWDRFGDHVFWLDLLGVGHKGVALHNTDGGVIYSLWEAMNPQANAPLPKPAVPWLAVGLPFVQPEPLLALVRHGARVDWHDVNNGPRVAVLRKMARRNPDLIPSLLAASRDRLQLFWGSPHGEQEQFEHGGGALAQVLVEWGTVEDRELVAAHFSDFVLLDRVQLLVDWHGFAHQHERALGRALDALDAPLFLALHQSLGQLCQSGDPGVLADWLQHPEPPIRQAILLGVYALVPRIAVPGPIFDLLLSHMTTESDPDCGVALGWCLGRLLERLGASAVLVLTKQVCALVGRDQLGFHVGLRAMARANLPQAPREEALILLNSVFALCTQEEEPSVRLACLYVGQGSMDGATLRAQLSERHGWLQDIAEPGRQWGGLLGELLEGRLDLRCLAWLSLHNECDAPHWLRTLWLLQVLDRAPGSEAEIRQACLRHDSFQTRSVAANALLFHREDVYPDPLRLACQCTSLPRCTPEESFGRAIGLLRSLIDPTQSRHARRLLEAGGSLFHETLENWEYAKHHPVYREPINKTIIEMELPGTRD